MVLAIDILFEKRKIRREKRVEEALDEKSFEEIIVFPIAFPFIAGPSASNNNYIVNRQLYQFS